MKNTTPIAVLLMISIAGLDDYPARRVKVRTGYWASYIYRRN